jgi:hypothetical protein
MVRGPFWDRISSLTEHPFSASILVLCLLIVFGAYTWCSPRQIHGPLDDGPLPPIVRLYRATVVGKSQGQTETFQGIPYARPP